MRFLADENCDMAIVRALRAAGHDVALVREQLPGAPDETVVTLARQDRRILLTEDKAFGQLAQALSAALVGVVLVRFPTKARSKVGPMVVNALEALDSPLEGTFMVIEPGQFRILRLEP